MLDITGLRVSYGNNVILDGIDLSLDRYDSLAVIGESGVGKTTLGLSIAGLVDGGKVEGQVMFDGQDILTLSEDKLNELRWNRISLVLQNAENVLNPVIPVIKQVMEPMVRHGIERKRAARERAGNLLIQTGLDVSRHEAYPHQLSGGERQRAMIAMALANDPEFIIMDEPTASLDALTRADILKLLAGIGKRRAFLVITHDIHTAAKLCSKTAVLYGGKLIEKGPSKDVFTAPRHPYTRGLLRSYPNMTTVKDLQGIRGRPEVPEKGCCFYPRCTQAVKTCTEEHPELTGTDGHYLACHRGGIVPLLDCAGINVNYGDIKAVSEVDARVYEGETLALVGESGSGKSSLAYYIMGLVKDGNGQVILDGSVVNKRDKNFFSRVQMVFQSPGESISHRQNVLQAVKEPLDIQNIGCEGARRENVRRSLDEVELPSDDDFLSRYPHHLSGGEAQRAAIARALVLQPSVIIADECTSALDASVQAKILKLLLDLQQNRGLGVLFITHDIALARKVSDRTAVMLSGRVVEEGPTERVVTRPSHPYTQALIDAAPGLDFIEEQACETGAGNDILTAAGNKDYSSQGCAFAARCSSAGRECLECPPPLVTTGQVKVACHRAVSQGDISRSMEEKVI